MEGIDKNLYKTYNKLVHEVPMARKYVVVNWCMGNVCNYHCSYCPDILHDGSIGWYDYEIVERFCTKVYNHYKPRKIYYEFTGGEITMWKDFPKISKYLHDLDKKNAIGIISNASRTLRWWKEYKNLIDHVSLSFHAEEGDPNHFIEVVKEIKDTTKTHVNMMMHFNKIGFKKCIDLADEIIKIGNVSIALQPLLIEFQDTMYGYSEEQMRIIDNQTELYESKIEWTKEYPIYRGPMKMVETKTKQEQVVAPHLFIANKLNSWKGWKCYAGVEQIVVDVDGSVWRGWCKVGELLGWVDKVKIDTGFGSHATATKPGLPVQIDFPKDPIICDKDFCHCNFDIMSTKEKV
jgi:MoaA/NifB/PqqE/SkfB family radical SAM enzyme